MCRGLPWRCLYFDTNSASSRGTAPTRSRLPSQVISLKLLPVLAGEMKARADDWAGEGKGGAGGEREEEEVEETGADGDGLE